MFQPNSPFEKRLLLLEDVLAELLSVAGLTGLLQNFRHSVESLKLEEVERVLGPVSVTDDSATYPRAAQLLKERLTNVGLLYRGAIEGEEEPPLSQENIMLRVGSLPSLDTAMGPEVANGLYHTQMQDGSVFPTLVIRKGLLVHLFVVGVDGIYPTTLSLKHMPPDFNWNSEQKDLWRTELFRYRQDLNFTTLSERLDNALVDLDFSEVDDQYQTLLQEAQRDADAMASQFAAEAQAAEVEGEAAAREIVDTGNEAFPESAIEQVETEDGDSTEAAVEAAVKSDPTAQEDADQAIDDLPVLDAATDNGGPTTDADDTASDAVADSQESRDQ